MIIRGWRIQRFGCLRDFEVSSLPDGITIVHGANEAGKSTLHAFLRGVLFGFSTARTTEGRLLHEGTSAGQLQLEIEGEQLRVERKNVSKQPVVVHRDSGAVGDERMLHRLLGNADGKLFRSIFAFGLRELQDFGTLNADQVRDRMFSATVGAGRTTPGAAAEELSERAKLLYRDKGANRGRSLVALTLEQLTNTDQEIRSARVAAREFPQIEREIQELTSNRDNLQTSERSLLIEKRTCESLIELAPQRDECSEIRLRLDALQEAPSISEEAERRFVQLRDELARQEAAVRERIDEHADAVARLAQLMPDDRLLGVAPALERVVEELALQRDRLARVSTAHVDGVLARQALDAQLERLGPEWTKERVALWKRSISRREQCQEWQIRIENTVAKEAELLKSASSATVALNDHQAESERLRAELPNPAPPLREELERRDAALHRIRGARETVNERRQEHLEAQARLADAERRLVPGGDAARPLLLFAAVALVGGAVLAYTGYKLPGMLVLAVAMVLLLLSLRRKPATSPNSELKLLRDRRDQAVAGLETSRAELARAAELLEVNASLSAEEVGVLSASVTRQREARSAYDARLQQLKASDVIERRLEERREAAVSEHATTKRELEQLRSDWAEQRNSFGIGETLSPAGCVVLMDGLDSAREHIDRLVTLEGTLQQTAEAASLWSAMASRALTLAGIPASEDPVSLLASVAALSSSVAKERDTKAQRDNAASQVAGLDARLAIATQARDALSAEMLASVHAVDCNNGLEFLSAASTSRDRRALETQLRSIEDRIGAVLRTFPDSSSADDELRRGRATDWEFRLSEIDDELAVCARKREACFERRADAIARQHATSVADDVATLGLTRSSLVAKAESEVSEWLALTLASSLIRRTREVYERERQPAVLAQATPLFQTVTGGRFERIRQREDGSGFDLLARTGEQWRESELSQGTQEQLYLCLRIALAQEFSKDRTVLPLIMDDVLVNFDPDRADAMAQVLADVGRSRQVLFFTCHPFSVERLRTHVADVRVVTLP